MTDMPERIHVILERGWTHSGVWVSSPGTLGAPGEGVDYIRADVVATKDAEINRLLEVLRAVDDDVRHHLRSEVVDHSLLRKHVVSMVRVAVANFNESVYKGQR